jgi:hypothetical protein
MPRPHPLLLCEVWVHFLGREISQNFIFPNKNLNLFFGEFWLLIYNPPSPPPRFVVNLLLHRAREKGKISELFAFVFCFFSTPYRYFFSPHPGWRVFGAERWGRSGRRGCNQTHAFACSFSSVLALRSLLCVLICCGSWNPIVIASAPRKE